LKNLSPTTRRILYVISMVLLGTIVIAVLGMMFLGRA
jgi:hypothetical protein